MSEALVDLAVGIEVREQVGTEPQKLNLIDGYVFTQCPVNPVVDVLVKLQGLHTIAQLGRHAVGTRLVLGAVTSCYLDEAWVQFELASVVVENHTTHRVLHRHGCVRQLLDDERTWLVSPIVTDAIELGHRYPLGTVGVSAWHAHDIHRVTK